MDTLRGNFAGGTGPLDDPQAHDGAEDGAAGETPPATIGQDERRMQVRAYNHWASLLGDRSFPAIDDLEPSDLHDFAPYSVLLDFTAGIENPGISYLGRALARECGTDEAITRLADVPARSLLSRITDHSLQILANQAPIGFEAEFENQRGQAILYRGILMPFSSDDDTIDFIYGVINWKELADQPAADEPMLQPDQAPDGEDGEEGSPASRRADPEPITDWADGPAAAGDALLPRPSFGLPETEAAAGTDEAPAGLADLLAAARDLAELARGSEERSRNALYDAIGRAYDFSLAAAREPGEYRALVAAAGLSVQDRAPMTPVVKLVFGADYDKTRLTEYAAALAHAHRLGIAAGGLGDFLRGSEGGLKGVVGAERRLRREEAGRSAGPAETPRLRIAGKLRQLEQFGFDAISPEGREFALVVIRRLETGAISVLGEISEDARLVERAARKLLA